MSEENQVKKDARPVLYSPLGIIALFVSLIETVATVSLNLVADKPFAVILVWFIVGFPTFVASAFFLILWKNRAALFGPMDYRDESTFKDLLRKVDVIEAKQTVASTVANIDVDSSLDDANRAVDKLIELGDPWAAIGIARAFLRKREFQKCQKIMQRIMHAIKPSDKSYYKVLANLAYAQIGLKEYKDAIESLRAAYEIDGGVNFGPWHAISLSYAYLMDGDGGKSKQWMSWARKHGGDELDVEFFATLYPELEDEIRSLAS